MKTTHKDRRDHELLRFLKERKGLRTQKERVELRRKFRIDTPDYHSAIRLTSSVSGSADCSRSAHRHYVQTNITRKLKRITLREFNNEIQEV